MGHRRLSVIDLSTAGRQPMASEDGSAWIAYNGEVYNFKEIRRMLEGFGRRFRTATDTEVILEAYAHWGIHCLDRFVGMFAFAIWDDRRKRLFLARDRLGIKPLYYHHVPGTFLFASELKAMMAFSVFRKEVDPEALPLFLHYQYVPAPRTIFKNTFKLLPGHYALYDGAKLEVQPYWQVPLGLEQDKNRSPEEGEVLEALDELLTRAVSDRLVSDVPLGALLSGGVDSSLIVSLMQKVNPSPARTFSIGFNETGHNEAPWAAKVAAHLGTEHTELCVTPRETLEVIPRLPEMYDEPFADSSAVPTALVCKMARSRVTVALSGDGGDEQFAGYVRYGTTQAMASAFRRLPHSVRTLMARILEHTPYRWVEKCYLPWRDLLPQRFRVVNFPDKWQKLVGMVRKTDLPELYRTTICVWPEVDIRQLTGRPLPRGRYEMIFQGSNTRPIISQLMRVDQHTYLADAMLTKVDRASMATGLEVRVPLLDHRVVEYTSVLPDELKYRNGRGKYILRKLLARYVPESLFERPKMGFGLPVDRWLRRELRPLLADYLSEGRLRREGLFDERIVQQKMNEHLSGKVNHQHRLWALLMWEMWRERWLGNQQASR